MFSLLRLCTSVEGKNQVVPVVVSNRVKKKKSENGEEKENITNKVSK